MALRGPSKSPRRQENTQVIVTKSSRHFSLPAWYLGPVPEGVHSLYRAGCCIHSDFSIAVEIQTKASVQKCFSLHGHPIFPREKTAPQSWFFLALPCWWICPYKFLSLSPSVQILSLWHADTGNSLELSPSENWDTARFLMHSAKEEQKLSAPTHQFCFIATRKHASFSVSLAHTHLLTSTHRKVLTFGTWSIGRYTPQESCSR